MAVVLSTAFFAHETVNLDYSNIEIVNSQYNQANSEKVKAFKLLTEKVSHLPEYEEYTEAKKNASVKYDVVIEEYKKIKFFSFNSFQEFMGEFGWALGLFIYSVFNVVKSLIRKTKTLYGEILLHTSLICIAIFYLRWCFNKVDFSKPTYIIANVFSAILLVLTAFIFIKYKMSIIVRYRKIILMLNTYIYDTEKDLKEDVKQEHKLKRGKLVHKIMEDIG